MRAKDLFHETAREVRGFAGKVARAIGVSRSTVYRRLNTGKLSARDERVITTMAVAHKLEVEARASGLRGGHEVLGIRRDVWTRYLRGGRSMVPARMGRTAELSGLDYFQLPGYAETGEVPFHEVMPYAEYVAFYRATGLVSESAAVSADIQHARRERQSDFWVEVWGVRYPDGSIHVDGVAVLAGA